MKLLLRYSYPHPPPPLPCITMIVLAICDSKTLQSVRAPPPQGSVGHPLSQSHRANTMGADPIPTTAVGCLRYHAFTHATALALPILH